MTVIIPGRRTPGRNSRRTRAAVVTCLICGKPAAERTLDVVSANWMDWDRCKYRSTGDGFCARHATEFRSKELRYRPHVDRGDGRWETLTPEMLGALLGEPIAAPVRVSVPVSRQIHVAPFAMPGRVATDRQSLAWTVADTERLAVLRDLRTRGFGEAALAEWAPRWVLLRRLDPADARLVSLLWPLLDEWRHRPVYLDVACRATRTTRECV